MNTATRFAGFTLGLAAVFGVALATGSVLGPEPTPPTAHDTAAHTGGGAATEIPGGLMVTDRGYTLRLENPIATPAPDAVVRFRILDAAGAPVTAYRPDHEKDLHLIAVRRDMVGYQHVHPTLDANGTWSAALDLTRAGEYRVFADFVPDGGPDLTLGADLRVAGDYDATPLPPPATVATVGEYSVTLEGALTPGTPAPLTLSVRRGGQPVTDLQPYLGAYGHLVALRAADLAYLHVHPQGHPGDGVTAPGPGIAVEVDAPSAGEYRLFLDFRHEGVVRTAEFTLRVTPDAGGTAESEHGAPAQPHSGNGATPAPAHTH